MDVEHESTVDMVQRGCPHGSASQAIQRPASNEKAIDSHCFVCNKSLDNAPVSLLVLTDTTKIHMYKKLGYILDSLNIEVTENETLCSRCAQLVNLVDQIEVELVMLKKSIVNCVKERCTLLGTSCRRRADNANVVAGGIVPKSKPTGVEDMCENTSGAADHRNADQEIDNCSDVYEDLTDVSFSEDSNGNSGAATIDDELHDTSFEASDSLASAQCQLSDPLGSIPVATNAHVEDGVAVGSSDCGSGSVPIQNGDISNISMEEVDGETSTKKVSDVSTQSSFDSSASSQNDVNTEKIVDVSDCNVNTKSGFPPENNASFAPRPLSQLQSAHSQTPVGGDSSRVSHRVRKPCVILTDAVLANPNSFHYLETLLSGSFSQSSSKDLANETKSESENGRNDLLNIPAELSYDRDQNYDNEEVSSNVDVSDNYIIQNLIDVDGECTVSQEFMEIESKYVPPEELIDINQASELNSVQSFKKKNVVGNPGAVTVWTTSASQHSARRVFDRKVSCVYCSRVISKLSPHLCARHRKEKEVKEFLSYPKGAKERKEILRKIKSAGNFEHNRRVIADNQGTLIPAKRPSKPVPADSYYPCETCLGFFLKKHLWRHSKVCQRGSSEVRTKYSRHQSSSLMLLPVPKHCHKGLVDHVLSRMQKDKITEAVTNDPVISWFGAKLYQKNEHQPWVFKYIMQKLRVLGRLMIAIKELDSNIKTLADCFSAGNFDLFLTSVRRVCGYDYLSEQYRSPSLAIKIGHSVRKCIVLLKGQMIASANRDLGKRVDEFRKEFDEKWTDVFEHANQSMKRQRLNRLKVVQPSNPEADKNSFPTSTSGDSAEQRATENIGSKFVGLSTTAEMRSVRRKKPGSKIKRRPWTESEKNVILRELSHWFLVNKVPGKDACLKCMENSEGILNKRTWQQVKYFVYNNIKKT